MAAPPSLLRPGGAAADHTARRKLGIETAAASADGPPPGPGPAFGEGPRVISRGGDTALVHFRHAARAATAVALQANGWWRPEPREACDLRPTGNGWWEDTFQVPADWRATYGYVEHEEDGDPPWWESGLKDPGAPVVSDLSNPRRHRAARGGAQRAVICVPDDGPFTPGLVKDEGEPSPSPAHPGDRARVSRSPGGGPHGPAIRAARTWIPPRPSPC